MDNTEKRINRRSVIKKYAQTIEELLIIKYITNEEYEILKEIKKKLAEKYINEDLGI